MGILDRYIVKETLAAWVGVSVVLSLILMGNVIAKLMFDVSEGRIDSEALLPFMGASALELLVTVIPLGVMLGTVLALGRLYRDSEMVAMTACGLSAWQLLRAVALASCLPLCFSALLSLWAAPWALQYQNNVLFELERSSRFDKLEAGQFVASSDQDSVIYTESIDRDQAQLGQIFIRNRSSSGSDDIETAARADYQFDAERYQEYIVLHNGRHLSLDPASGEYTVIDYQHHGIALPPSEVMASQSQPKAQSTPELLKSTDTPERVELHWRLALPLAVLALVLLAVPLSHTAPRKSPYGRVAVGVLVYIVFANLLAVGRKTALSDGAGALWMLYLPHALVLLGAMGLLAKQQGYFSRWSPVPSHVPSNKASNAQHNTQKTAKKQVSA